MTDEQFKQLMEKLEQILRAQHPGYFNPPPVTMPGQCLNCGGWHGAGILCPNLRGVTVSNNERLS